MRLLRRWIDQICADDHLPATFHNVNAGMIEQKLEVRILEHISLLDMDCDLHVKKLDPMAS